MSMIELAVLAVAIATGLAVLALCIALDILQGEP